MFKHGMFINFWIFYLLNIADGLDFSPYLPRRAALAIPIPPHQRSPVEDLCRS
jgi:hypothetical protein